MGLPAQREQAKEMSHIPWASRRSSQPQWLGLYVTPAESVNVDREPLIAKLPGMTLFFAFCLIL